MISLPTDTTLAHLPEARILSRLPEFLVIGAQRAGTTSFYEHLTRHRQVAPAAVKETHFFSLFYLRGLRWYRNQFPGCGGITGEATPYYLFHPAVPERVRTDCPDVSLIVLLRDPVERAFSQYKHSVKHGWETLSFDEAVREEPGRLRHEADRLLTNASYRSFAHQHLSYAARGHYADHLERWLGWFPRQQLLVISSESFFRAPRHVLARTFRFLGLGDEDTGPLQTMNASNAAAAMSDDTRARLRDHFDPHNLRLFEMLGEDLGWNHA